MVFILLIQAIAMNSQDPHKASQIFTLYIIQPCNSLPEKSIKNALN